MTSGIYIAVIWVVVLLLAVLVVLVLSRYEMTKVSGCFFLFSAAAIWQSGSDSDHGASRVTLCTKPLVAHCSMRL